MSIFEILLIAVALSMDAFAVSAVSGMTMTNINLKTALIIGATFGIFQGLMPYLGYTLAENFSTFMQEYAPIIACVLLLGVGGKMLWDSSFGEAEPLTEISIKVLLIQGIATSLDALAVGVGFLAMQVSILPACLLIATTTALLSVVAVQLGKCCSGLLANHAGFVGGLVLIAIGIKMLF